MVDFAEAVVKIELVKRGRGLVQDPNSKFIHIFVWPSMNPFFVHLLTISAPGFIKPNPVTSTQQLHCSPSYKLYSAFQRSLLVRSSSLHHKVWSSLIHCLRPDLIFVPRISQSFSNRKTLMNGCSTIYASWRKISEKLIQCCILISVWLIPPSWFFGLIFVSFSRRIS